MTTHPAHKRIARANEIAEPADPIVYTGHCADLDMDFLVTVYPDGTHELATRPGRDERRTTWGAPVRLEREAVTA